MFDIIVFGVMVLWALQASIDPTHPKGEELKMDLLTARRLLVEYLEMVQEYDHRDAILLGQIVTPAKVISAAVTVAGSLMTLYVGMMKSGRVKVPGPLAGIAAGDAGHAMSLTGIASMYNVSEAFTAFGY